MLEYQLLEAHPIAILFNVGLEMCYRLPGMTSFEHYAAYFVIEVSANGFDLHTICVYDPNFSQICIAL